MKKKRTIILFGFSIVFMQATLFSQTENPPKKVEMKTEIPQPIGEIKTNSSQQTEQKLTQKQVGITQEKKKTAKPTITLSNK